MPGDLTGEDMVISFTMESISRSYLSRRTRARDCERFSETKVLSAAAAVAGEAAVVSRVKRVNHAPPPGLSETKNNKCLCSHQLP